MNRRVPISEMMPCNCPDLNPKWKVIKIEVDDKLEERFKKLIPKSVQKRILEHQKRIGSPLSKKLYVLTIQCSKCGFTWHKYILDKQLKENKEWQHYAKFVRNH